MNVRNWSANTWGVFVWICSMIFWLLLAALIAFGAFDVTSEPPALMPICDEKTNIAYFIVPASPSLPEGAVLRMTEDEKARFCQE